MIPEYLSLKTICLSCLNPNMQWLLKIWWFQIVVEVFYPDLSYESIEETESYPFKEMINELAGISGLYCKTVIVRTSTQIIR